MIRKEAVVDVPVAAAWKAWTTQEGVESFFAPEAIVEARPDGPYAIHFNPYAPPGMKGADGMRVLAVQENRMISFTWNAPPQFPEARGQRTVVIVRTEPLGEATTRVTLTHLGWGSGPSWDGAYDYFDKAWGTVMEWYEKRFREGPTDWKPRLEAMRTSRP